MIVQPAAVSTFNRDSEYEFESSKDFFSMENWYEKQITI